MSLILPLVALAGLAWLVPWILGRLLPEGVIWLLVIGLLSAAILTVVSAVGFWWLYGAAGGAVLQSARWHFVVLSAKAAIVWGPVMVLSISTQPAKWTKAVW